MKRCYETNSQPLSPVRGHEGYHKRQYKKENDLITQVQLFLYNLATKSDAFWILGTCMSDGISGFACEQLQYVKHLSYHEAEDKEGNKVRSISEFITSDEPTSNQRSTYLRILFRGMRFFLFAFGIGRIHEDGLLYLHSSECNFYWAGIDFEPPSIVKRIDISNHNLFTFILLFNLDVQSKSIVTDHRAPDAKMDQLSFIANTLHLLHFALLGLYLLHCMPSMTELSTMSLASICPFAFLLTDASALDHKQTIPHSMRYNCMYFSINDTTWVFPKHLTLFFMLFKCSQQSQRSHLQKQITGNADYYCIGMRDDQKNENAMEQNSANDYAKGILEGTWSAMYKKWDLETNEWEDITEPMNIITSSIPYHSIRLEPYPLIKIRFHINENKSIWIVPNATDLLTDYLPLQCIEAIHCFNANGLIGTLTNLQKDRTFLALRERVLKRNVLSAGIETMEMIILVQKSNMTGGMPTLVQVTIDRIRLSHILTKNKRKGWNGRIYLEPRIKGGWWEGSISMNSFDLTWKGIPLASELSCMLDLQHIDVDFLFFPNRKLVFEWFHLHYPASEITKRIAEKCIVLLPTTLLTETERLAVLISNVLCYQQNQVRRSTCERRDELTFVRSDYHWFHDVSFDPQSVTLGFSPFQLYLDGIVFSLSKAIELQYGSQKIPLNKYFLF